MNDLLLRSLAEVHCQISSLGFFAFTRVANVQSVPTVKWLLVLLTWTENQRLFNRALPHCEVDSVVTSKLQTSDEGTFVSPLVKVAEGTPCHASG